MIQHWLVERKATKVISQRTQDEGGDNKSAFRIGSCRSVMLTINREALENIAPNSRIDLDGNFLGWLKGLSIFCLTSAQCRYHSLFQV
jgi:hypothetical protein